MRILALALIALPLLFTSGCFFKRKQQQRPPVATIPPAPKVDPVVLPAPPPPRIEASKPATGKAPPSVATTLPEAPKPPQTSKPPSRRTRRNAAQAKPNGTGTLPTADPNAVDAGQQPAVSPLKLGEFLSETQKAEIQKQFDQTMQRARSSLEKLTAKKLEGTAAESVDRVRSFLLQADQARARDPQTALQLAQRADVLATDLLNR